MIYRIEKGQVSMGEPVGILLLDTSVPFVPGDVANATTWNFPVRFKKLRGFSVERALKRDPSNYEQVLKAARELKEEAGVRGITSDCGFLGLFQKPLAQDLGMPVFLSSLMQADLLLNMLGGDQKIGVITVDSSSLDDGLLKAVGVRQIDRLFIAGLQQKKNFHAFALAEVGELDFKAVSQEVVEVALEMLRQDSSIGAFLLECSLLPPYAASVQQAVGKPVFDFTTLVNFAFSGIQRREFTGFV